MKSSSTIAGKKLRLLYMSAVILVAFISLTLPLTVFASSTLPAISYTYNCTGSTVYVTVDIEGVAGYANITLPRDTGVLEESIVAVDQDNNVLPVFTGDNYITIILGSNTRSVTLSYIILVEPYGDIYMLGINPSGKATIVLPVNASLRYASDSPEVFVNTSRITLSYSEPGSYIIYYAVTGNTVPPSETTMSTSPVSTVTGTTGQSVSGTLSSTGAAAGTTGREGYLTAAAAIALLAAVIGYLLRKRQPGASSSSGEKPGIEVVVDTASLDERDNLLLSLISKEEHTVSSLSRASGLSKSVVWRRIKKLESLGLVETSRDTGRAYIRLTDKGKKLLEGS